MEDWKNILKKPCLKAFDWRKLIFNLYKKSFRVIHEYNSTKNSNV